MSPPAAPLALGLTSARAHSATSARPATQRVPSVFSAADSVDQALTVLLMKTWDCPAGLLASWCGARPVAPLGCIPAHCPALIMGRPQFGGWQHSHTVLSARDGVPLGRGWRRVCRLGGRGCRVKTPAGNKGPQAPDPGTQVRAPCGVRGGAGPADNPGVCLVQSIPRRRGSRVLVWDRLGEGP